MELNVMVALLEAELQAIKDRRDLEITARDVLSNFLTQELQELFPGAPDTFLTSNGHFSNELARGAGEIADAVASAGVNWTGPAQDTVVEELTTSELVKLLATEDLVTGKIALYPRVDEQGRFDIEVLTGYLHPVFSPGNALRVEEVLQVIFDPATQKFEVRRYAPGVVEVYPQVDDWLTFSDNAPRETYAQPHAMDRLPLAFAVTRRDAHRNPYGLICECLSAYRRYMRSAVNRNAVQEVAGFPEVVVKSDRYLDLLLGTRTRPGVGQGQEDPAITALKKRGARQVKFLGSEDVYEVTAGVDPASFLDSEQADKQALLDLLRSPDLNGGNQTEVALATRGAKHRALIIGMCQTMGAVLTDAFKLGAAITRDVPEGIRVTLTPTFPADTFQRTTQAAELYKAGGLTRSQLLMELQSLGWNSVTDDEIEAAKRQEGLLNPPVTDDPEQDASVGPAVADAPADSVQA